MSLKKIIGSSGKGADQLPDQLLPLRPFLLWLRLRFPLLLLFWPLRLGREDFAIADTEAIPPQLRQWLGPRFDALAEAIEDFEFAQAAVLLRSYLATTEPPTP